MSIADQMKETQDAEWVEAEARQFAEYDGTHCKFCNRLRVGITDHNGRYCEKCDRFQDTEFGQYVPITKTTPAPQPMRSRQLVNIITLSELMRSGVDYPSIGVDRFVGDMMKASHGAAKPQDCRVIYGLLYGELGT